MEQIVNKFKAKYTKYSEVSRYKNLYRLLNDKDEEYIESYDKITIPKNKTDTFHVVTKADENRLDLISFNYYNTPLLWWVIAEASDITDPFNVPINTVLRIPNKQSLYGIGGILS
jgi:nucleoid-associated protein YgaU